jgi:hypothetical protein
VHDTKTGKNVPNGHKISQMSNNIPNGHKKIKTFSNLRPSKFTQIGIFGLKTNHLATLLGSDKNRIWSRK